MELYCLITVFYTTLNICRLETKQKSTIRHQVVNDLGPFIHEPQQLSDVQMFQFERLSLHTLQTIQSITITVRTVICETVNSPLFAHIVFRFCVIFTTNSDHLVQWYWLVYVINTESALCEEITEIFCTIRQTSVFRELFFEVCKSVPWRMATQFLSSKFQCRFNTFFYVFGSVYHNLFFYITNRCSCLQSILFHC